MSGMKRLRRSKRYRTATPNAQIQGNRNPPKTCMTEQSDCPGTIPKIKVQSDCFLENVESASEGKAFAVNSGHGESSLDTSSKSTKLRRSRRACSLLATGRLKNIYPPVDLFGPEEDFVQLVKEVRKTHQLDQDDFLTQVDNRIDLPTSRQTSHLSAGKPASQFFSKPAEELAACRESHDVERDIEANLSSINVDTMGGIGARQKVKIVGENAEESISGIQDTIQQECPTMNITTTSQSMQRQHTSECCKTFGVPKQDRLGTTLYSSRDRKDEESILHDAQQCSKNKMCDQGVRNSLKSSSSPCLARGITSRNVFWDGFELKDPRKVC